MNGEETRFKHGNRAAEEWVKIKYFNRYEISTLGGIRFIKRNGNYSYRNPSKNKQGYIQFGITEKYKTTKKGIHRWMMESFMPIENMKKYEVNHIDGNKGNNNINNLEWCTPKENQLHRRNVLGKNDNGCDKMVLDNRNGIFYKNAKEAHKSRKLNIKYDHFTSILKGNYQNNTDFIYV